MIIKFYPMAEDIWIRKFRKLKRILKQQGDEIVSIDLEQTVIPRFSFWIEVRNRMPYKLRKRLDNKVDYNKMTTVITIKTKREIENERKG